MSRTHRISVIGSTALALTLAATACGSSGPGMSEDALQVWALEEAAVNDVLQAGMDSYNEGAEIESELVTFVNDAYKQRLQVALGSPNAPDVFFNWGGGNLGEYVDQGQVFNMTTALDENPGFRDSFLPSVLDVARIEDGYYGVPMLGMQPVVLFTNDAVLEESGLEAPRTYDELLEAIEVLKEDEVTPIVLPGAQGWTQLMWLSYLVERIGGPDVFQAVVDGQDKRARRVRGVDPHDVDAFAREQLLVALAQRFRRNDDDAATNGLGRADERHVACVNSGTQGDEDNGLAQLFIGPRNQRDARLVVEDRRRTQFEAHLFSSCSAHISISSASSTSPKRRATSK